MDDCVEVLGDTGASVLGRILCIFFTENKLMLELKRFYRYYFLL